MSHTGRGTKAVAFDQGREDVDALSDGENVHNDILREQSRIGNNNIPLSRHFIPLGLVFIPCYGDIITRMAIFITTYGDLFR